MRADTEKNAFCTLSLFFPVYEKKAPFFPPAAKPPSLPHKPTHDKWAGYEAAAKKDPGAKKGGRKWCVGKGGEEEDKNVA